MGGVLRRLAYWLPNSEQRALDNAEHAITLAEQTASDQMRTHQDTLAALDRETRDVTNRILTSCDFDGELTVYDKSRLTSIFQKKTSCMSSLKYAADDHRRAMYSRGLLDQSRHNLDVAKRSKYVSRALDYLQQRTPQLAASIAKSADTYAKLGEDQTEVTVAMEELDEAMPEPQQEEEEAAETKKTDKVDAMFAQAMFDFHTEKGIRSLPLAFARKTLLPQHAVRAAEPGVAVIEIEMA